MTNINAAWSRPDDNGIRSFLPHGRAKKVRFILKDKDGNVVDRCGVQNVSEDIKDTYNELVRLHGGGEFTYELGEHISF